MTCIADYYAHSKTIVNMEEVVDSNCFVNIWPEFPKIFVSSDTASNTAQEL